MRYYKKTNGAVVSIGEKDDGSFLGDQTHLVEEDWVELEVGEFVDTDFNLKPYKLDGYIAVERDVEGNIIAPQSYVDHLQVTDKETKLTYINNWYETEVAKLTKGVPNTEISTWDRQEAEARAYVADNSASTPFIDNLVLARGVTKEYLVGKIIEKADAYAIAVGVLTGERQRREDELV